MAHVVHVALVRSRKRSIEQQTLCHIDSFLLNSISMVAALEEVKEVLKATFRTT